jgi:hypothetical protein
LEYYKTCEELPLKIFFKVAESGSFKYLLKKESAKIDLNELQDAWEDIIIEYGRLDRNLAVTNAVEKSNQVIIYAAQYLEVRAMLIYLREIEYKQEYIDRLRELGYRIDLKENYIGSLDIGERRVNNIITKLGLLEKEIETLKEGNTSTSFDAAMAWMMSHNISGLSEDITVKRYIEVKKQIHERNKSVGHSIR